MAGPHWVYVQGNFLYPMDYGGVLFFRRIRPFMMGRIAGEMLAGLFTMGHGALHYWSYELPPRVLRLMPG
jgi:hypothetical protein